jgi:hypothetical protein
MKKAGSEPPLTALPGTEYFYALIDIPLSHFELFFKR